MDWARSCSMARLAFRPERRKAPFCRAAKSLGLSQPRLCPRPATTVGRVAARTSRTTIGDMGYIVSFGSTVENRALLQSGPGQGPAKGRRLGWVAVAASGKADPGHQGPRADAHVRQGAPIRRS